MTYLCPKGHDSTDPDYCSECGARIGAQSAVSTPAAAPSTDSTCPDCGTARTPGSRFCEVCRYDFVSKLSPPSQATSVAAPADAGPAIAPQIQAPAPALPVPAAFDRLQVVIAADASLLKETDPANPFPAGTPERVFHLDLEDNLVGRFSESKDSHPEIPVKDPGISRRHLKFLRQPGGNFAVLELGSANGTELNGQALEPGVSTPLTPGDVLVLGMWTRMTIQAR